MNPAPRQRRASILTPATPRENTHPRLHSPFILPGSRKARPTVCISTTSASCTASLSPDLIHVSISISAKTTAENHPPSPTNIIPFPCSNTPLPSAPPECLGLLRNAPPQRTRLELRHRRSQARLAQSPIARKDASSKGKHSAHGRSQSTNVQLLRTMYRSVAAHSPSTINIEDAAGPSPDEGHGEEVMQSQERLFVRRLCESMLDLGCHPITIISTPKKSALTLLPASSPMDADAPRILTMPQLVATLMLHHRDHARRAATRLRPALGVSSMKSSPLAMSVDVHS